MQPCAFLRVALASDGDGAGAGADAGAGAGACVLRHEDLNAVRGRPVLALSGIATPQVARSLGIPPPPPPPRQCARVHAGTRAHVRIHTRSARAPAHAYAQQPPRLLLPIPPRLALPPHV